MFRSPALVAIAALLTTASAALAQDALPRRGSFGIGGQPSPEGGLAISIVAPDGAAAKAGMRPGDRLIGVDGQRATDSDVLLQRLRRSPAGVPVKLTVIRDGQEQELTAVPPALASEQVEGSVVTYTSVQTADGTRLRVILTEPQTIKASGGRAPAFFFIQGMPCASLDRPTVPEAADTQIVHAMAKAGYVTVRVDKSGLGDSLGPPCEDIDFATELTGYSTTLSFLKSLPTVDPDRVYLFGHSMGGIMAPYLALHSPVRGIVVFGTGMKTWLEYSMENVRRQLALAGADEAAITDAVLRTSRLFGPVLIDKQLPGEVFSRHPDLRPEDDDQIDDQRIYGRHARFYHQLQDRNLSAAWQTVSASVLAIYGQYDWVTTKADHDLIARIVSARPGVIAESLTLPKCDHGFTLHESEADSFREMGQGRFDQSLPAAVLAWIERVEAKTRPESKPADPPADQPADQPAENKPAAAAPAAPAPARAGLPTSPIAWTRLTTDPYRGKQDDIHFINPNVGWYVNGAGRLYRTTDGGATWTKLIDQPGSFFRCVGFVDQNRGLIGSIGAGYYPEGTDPTPLFLPTDGGKTLTPVARPVADGQPVVGLCAIEIVRIPSVDKGNLGERVRIVAAGRVGGPAVLITSDDLGQTWKRIKLPESAQAAFDVHFFDDRHGILASATSANVADSSALILTTDDGGETWREAYRSARPFELTWKIAFPTRQVGYVTLQSYNPDTSADERYVLKTTDGGATWSELPLVTDQSVRQFGVAFVDENTGWVGAMPGGFHTTDGGRTWMRADFGNAVNKIRVVRDGDRAHLYAIGVNLSKLTLPNARAQAPAR
ncbi:MAG: alpha/beta fold hydrolase [bacterium]